MRMRFRPVRTLWLLVIWLSAAALPVILVEAGLRIAGYGYPSAFFVPIPGSQAWTTNQKFGRRFFPVLLARTPLPERFAAAKEPRTFRIFILGESAAMGFPEPGFSFGRHLEMMLRRMYPDRHFEVIQAAMTAINSHTLLPIAKNCAALQPDLFIVYAGNNEVVGPYGAGTVFSGHPGSLGLIRGLIWLNGTRMGQWLSQLGQRRAGPAQWRGMEMFLGHTVAADDPRLQTVYANFRRNLEDMCQVARLAGAPMIVSTVAVNLKDSPPFASMHRALTDSARGTWEENYRAGVALGARGAHPDALQRFAVAKSLDDGFADLRFHLGQSLLALGKIEDARHEFTTARDLDALRFRADSHINNIIREVAGTSGARLVDTERIFERQGIPGNELFHEHVHLNFAGNDLLARTLAPEAAALLPGLAPAPAPDEQTVAHDLAWTAWDDYRARADITAMMRRPPFTKTAGDVRAPGNEAMEEAKARYLEIVKARPDDLRVRERFADLLAVRADLPAAETEWRDLLRRIPDVQSWRVAFASVLANENKLDEALEEYQRALRSDPQSAAAQFGAGSVLQRKRRWDEAAGFYAAALHLNPTYAEVENNLGLMRMQSSGDAPGAAAHYRAALRMNEEYAEAHNNLGLALSATGDWDGAIEHYRRAIAPDPGLAATQLNLAGALARCGRRAEATSAYEQVLQAHPDDFEAHHSLAGLLARDGQFQPAREHLETAVRLRPASSAAHYDLGSVLSRQGMLPEAISEYTKALQLRPDYAECWNNLGSALARRGNLSRAVVCFKKAIELRPDFAAARTNLAAALGGER